MRAFLAALALALPGAAQAASAASPSPTTSVGPGIRPASEPAAEDGQIAGTVLSSATQAPIEGIEVCAYESPPSEAGLAEGPPEYCTQTSPSGEYSISDLPPSAYVVEFTDPASGELDYVTQFYSAKTSFSEATPVMVPALGAISEIDAELSLGGTIAGRATNASTGAALENVLVCAFMSTAEVGGCAATDRAGEYIIRGLAPGQYQVAFLGGPEEFIAQYYDGAGVASEAQLVDVAVGETTAGIDAAMWPGIFKAPVVLSPPTVSGSTAVGAALSCASGSWSANPPPTFTYTWLRDGTPIAAATQSGYTVQEVDVGHSLSCEVQATNKAAKSGVGRAISSPVVVSPPPLPPAPTQGAKAKVAASLAPLLALDATRISISKKHTARVRVRCERALCRGSIELVAGPIVLAKGSFSLAKGRIATVNLRLTKAGLKRLDRPTVGAVKARLTIAVHGGSQVSKTVTVI